MTTCQQIEKDIEISKRAWAMIKATPDAAKGETRHQMTVLYHVLTKLGLPVQRVKFKVGAYLPSRGQRDAFKGGIQSGQIEVHDQPITHDSREALIASTQQSLAETLLRHPEVETFSRHMHSIVYKHESEPITTFLNAAFFSIDCDMALVSDIVARMLSDDTIAIDTNTGARRL